MYLNDWKFCPVCGESLDENKSSFIITDLMVKKYVNSLLPLGSSGDLLKLIIIEDFEKIKQTILKIHPEMNLKENWNRFIK